MARESVSQPAGCVTMNGAAACLASVFTASVQYHCMVSALCAQTGVRLKITGLGYMTPCSLVGMYLRFGGTHCLVFRSVCKAVHC
jgi:hypothetical protein